MSAIFPKYHELICNTYTPPFVAGAEDCVLQSGNVTRSRLEAGGALFRSVETAGLADVNAIAVSVTVTLISGDGVTGNNIYDVVFNYTDVGGVPQTPITVEQRLNNVSGLYAISGIDTLRAALVGNTILTMPSTDTPSGWTPASDADFITQFGTGSPPEALLLSGGTGLPASGVGFRTGPAFSLYHIDSADTAEDGSLEAINEISEWDGTQWLAHPSTLYDPDVPPPCP